MTNIHIISDLHLENNKGYVHKQPECDLVIVAGDVHPVGPYSKGIKWLNETFSVPVIYISGNHEYYTFPFDFNQVDDAIKVYISREGPNKIIYLQNDVYYFKNIRILGCTLWTNWDLNGNPAESMAYANRAMNDYYYSCYAEQGTFLTPENTLDEHNMSVEFLIEELSKPWRGKTIVVTHHCPHPNSIHPRYTDDKLNPAFTSDLSNIIDKLEPNYWIHGHTHSSFDYIRGKTRIICNPLGYTSRMGHMENPEYKKDLVINV